MRHLRLPIHKMKREPIDRIIERDSLPTAWSIQIMDLGGARKRLRRKLEVLQGLDYESRAAEFVLVALDGADHKRLGSIALVEGAIRSLVRELEPEVQKELMRFVEILVRVVDVRDALQDDLLSLRHAGVGIRKG